MKNNVIELPVRQKAIALPEKTRRINPLALKRREIERRIPEEDIMWRMAMKVLDERGRTGPRRARK